MAASQHRALGLRTTGTDREGLQHPLPNLPAIQFTIELAASPGRLDRDCRVRMRSVEWIATGRCRYELAVVASPSPLMSLGQV